MQTPARNGEFKRDTDPAEQMPGRQKKIKTANSMGNRAAWLCSNSRSTFSNNARALLRWKLSRDVFDVELPIAEVFAVGVVRPGRLSSSYGTLSETSRSRCKRPDDSSGWLMVAPMEHCVEGTIHSATIGSSSFTTHYGAAAIPQYFPP